MPFTIVFFPLASEYTNSGVLDRTYHFVDDNFVAAAVADTLGPVEFAEFITTTVCSTAVDN